MANSVTVLKRFGHKGQFVKYPSKWRHRMVHTGMRRYDTRCDLLVGMCACGERHTEEDRWVRELLIDNNCVIESHEEWLARARKEKELLNTVV